SDFRRCPDVAALRTRNGTDIRAFERRRSWRMNMKETQPKPILVADDVRKIYRSGSDSIVALHGLDLVVPHGQFLAVMGPSGSGKTTLLNCLSGLDEIDAGR